MDKNLNLESPDYWKRQIERGLQWRKQTSKEASWGRFKQYYEHKFENTLDPHFNLTYMMGSVLLPSLVFQNPSIINTPHRPEFDYWGRFFDGIDNWLVGEMELQDILEEGVLSAFLQNLIGIEIGYDYPDDRTVVLEEMKFDPIPGVDRSRKTNQPWLDMIEAENLVLCPGTTRMRNCRWYAKNTILPLSRLKKIKGLKNIVQTHIPTEISGLAGNEYMKDLGAEGFTSLWLIHSAEDKKWSWLNTNGEFVLPPEEDPLQIDGLPLEVLTFNRGIRSVWGTPDAAYIETQHLEGDELRRDGRLQRRLALVKAFYDNNLLEEEDIEKFLTSGPMGCIPVNVPIDKNLGDCISIVQPHVQGEFFGYGKELLNDAQLIAGHGPNQLGTFAPGRRTAKETGVVEEQAFLRLGARRQKIANIVAKIFGKVNQIIIKEWKAPLVQKVIGVEGAVHWVRGIPSEFSELAAQLVTQVNVESLAPTSKDRRRSEMLEVMNVVAKFVQVAQGQINPLPIIQQFLSQFDWLDLTKTLPQAMQNGPASLQDFAGQQQGLMQNPQGLAQQLQTNLSGVGGLINKLPDASQQQMEG